MEYRMDRNFVYQCCKTYANLDDGEIEAVLDVVRVLPYFAQANDYEVFVDVAGEHEGEALVVAEVFREGSIYQHSFLGERVYRKDEPAVFRAFELGVLTHNIPGISYDTQTKAKILTKQTTMPIRHGEKTVAVLILEKALDYEVRDLSAQGEALSEQQNITDVLLSVAGFKRGAESQLREGILVFSPRGELIYYNSTAEKIYKDIGYHTLEGLHFDNLSFSSVCFRDLLDRVARSPAGEGGDPGGSVYDARVSIGEKSYAIRVSLTGHRSAKLIVLIEDVTNLSQYESQIKNYLVSYQEIHHRVKNNLQTVASLLRLQSYTCSDEATRQVLSDSINRILSIAVTHDLLARRSGDQASMMEVVRRLVRNSADYGNPSGADIKFFVQGDDFPLDSQKATVVSLVINELIQNSIKYAFPDRASGEIGITLSSEDGIQLIEVRDNGVGYDPSAVNGDSLGLTIVKSYVEETLKGKLIIGSGEHGTVTSFAFKK